MNANDFMINGKKFNTERNSNAFMEKQSPMIMNRKNNERYLITEADRVVKAEIDAKLKIITDEIENDQSQIVCSNKGIVYYIIHL